MIKSLYKTVTRQNKGNKRYWLARVIFTEPGSIKKHDLQRRAKTKKEAHAILDKLVTEINGTAGRSINYDKATFNDYLLQYKELHVQPAKIVDGTVVSGLRSPESALQIISALSKDFGDRRLRSITYKDLLEYKTAFFNRLTRFGKPPAVATFIGCYNMLALILKRARQEGWIARNPCEDGESLTQKLVSNVRQRVLSQQEEITLLTAFRAGPSVMCLHHRFFDLDLLLKIGLDTGQRRGEMLKMQWKNVDLKRRVIFIPKEITKPFRERYVPISERVAEKLEPLIHELEAQSKYDPEGYVFGGLKDHTTTWSLKSKKAGVLDIRVHDLRRSFVTRISSRSVLSPFVVAYVAGHAIPPSFLQLMQTFKYFIGNWETAILVKGVIDAINQETESLMPPYDFEAEQAKRQEEFVARSKEYLKNHKAGVERASREGRMGRPPSWPVEKEAEIIRLYDEEALTQSKIAESLNIRIHTVGNVIRKALKNGVIKEAKDIRRTQRKGVDMEETVVELYDSGLGRYRIMEKTGLGLSTVRRILERTPHKRQGEYTVYKSRGKEPKILKLYGQGQNFTQIGRHVQLSKSTVSKIVRAAVKEGRIKPLTSWQKRRLELGCTQDRAKGKVDEIVRLYDEQGLSYREIGIRVDLSAQVILNIVHRAIKDGRIKEAKDPFRVRRAAGKCVGRESEILALRASGLSIPKIAAQTGITTGPLYNFFSKRTTSHSD